MHVVACYHPRTHTLISESLRSLGQGVVVYPVSEVPSSLDKWRSGLLRVELWGEVKRLSGQPVFLWTDLPVAFLEELLVEAWSAGLVLGITAITEESPARTVGAGLCVLPEARAFERSTFSKEADPRVTRHLNLILPVLFSWFNTLRTLRETRAFLVESHSPYRVIFGTENRTELPAQWQAVVSTSARSGVIQKSVLETFQETDGRTVPVALQATFIPLPCPATPSACGLVLGLVDDLTDLQAVTQNVTQLKRQMQELVSYDALTGLGNRGLFDGQVEDYMQQAARQGMISALVLVDTDNFKFLNDTYGHAFGDKVLVELARRFRNSVRNLDRVYRLGGDEFAMLMSVKEAEQLPFVLNRLMTRLREPFENMPQGISCSIGYALYPKHTSSLTQLRHYADAAVYQAKAEGKGCFCSYDQRTKAAMEWMLAEPLETWSPDLLVNHDLHAKWVPSTKGDWLVPKSKDGFALPSPEHEQRLLRFYLARKAGTYLPVTLAGLKAWGLDVVFSQNHFVLNGATLTGTVDHWGELSTLQQELVPLKGRLILQAVPSSSCNVLLSVLPFSGVVLSSEHAHILDTPLEKLSQDRGLRAKRSVLEAILLQAGQAGIDIFSHGNTSRSGIIAITQ